MINVARQAFANPFLSAAGVSFQPGFQPGGVSSVGRCPTCGNPVALANTIQAQTAGLNPLGVGATFGQQLGQQMGGFVPNPYGISQTTGFGQINPLASQFGSGVPQAINPLASQFGSGVPQGINPFASQFGSGVPQGINPFASQFGLGVPQGINPFVAQLASSWPGSGHLAHQGVAGRVGAYGADPRFAMGVAGQHVGYNDPNAILGSINPAIAGDPIGSLFSQQVNPVAQQQLPIRPLIGGQQAPGSQSFIPGFASPVNQWSDPYRAFIEAQLISQLASNPLYQLQRAYGVIPEGAGLGMPLGAGQQFNPLFANVPFYG